MPKSKSITSHINALYTRIVYFLHAYKIFSISVTIMSNYIVIRNKKMKKKKNHPVTFLALLLDYETIIRRNSEGLTKDNCGANRRYPLSTTEEWHLYEL